MAAKYILVVKNIHIVINWDLDLNVIKLSKGNIAINIKSLPE